MDKVQHQLEMLKSYFLNRTDVLAGDLPATGKPCPMRVKDLDKLLISHLTGLETDCEFIIKNKPKTIKASIRLGSYTPNIDNKTKWMCIDIDGGNSHQNPVKFPIRTTRLISNLCKKAKLTYSIEKSRSGDGYHIWVFFEKPIEAFLAQKLGHLLVPANIPLLKGGMADSKKGKGVEVFPKSIKISEEGHGALVYLPFHYSAEGGKNSFYFFVTDTKLRLDKTPTITPNIPYSVENAIIILSCEHPIELPIENLSFPKDNKWKEWRIEALTKVELAKIYEKNLTGNSRKNGEWLECRSPESEDRNPSAGVYDKGERYERGMFHCFISGNSLSLFDFMINHGEAKNFQHACELLAELTDTPLPAMLNSSDDNLPSVIITGRQQRDVVKDFWKVLHIHLEQNKIFFRLGDILVEPVLNRLGGGELREVESAKLTSILIRATNIMRIKQEKYQVPAILPPYVVADMIALPDNNIPKINSILGSPFFNKTGELIVNQGFHFDDEVYLNYPQSFIPHYSIGEISQKEARSKVEWLKKEILSDFPFTDESDKSHFLAALFQPFIRMMITGPTPLYLISASSPGSGKSLLAKCLSIIVIGAEVSSRVLSRSEDERRKMITAELISGRSIILLDNLDEDPTNGSKKNDRLNSPSLASVLTATEYSDRLLGQSRTVHLPNRCLWLMTGNNPVLSLELSRRCALIRLEPSTSQPWLIPTENLRHPDLSNWIQENRMKLLEVTLEVIKSWLDAGKPIVNSKKLGSYESWSVIMGSLLSYLGQKDFLMNQQKIERAVDPKEEACMELVELWFKKFKFKQVSASDILTLESSTDLFELILGVDDFSGKKVALGKFLSRKSGCVFNHKKIVIAENSEKKGNKYALISTKTKIGKGGIRGNLSNNIDPLINYEEIIHDY
jgi:hypothetical protein